MTTHLEISTDSIDPECTYHDCEEPPVEIWQGLSLMPESGQPAAWVAGYCPTHVEEIEGGNPRTPGREQSDRPGEHARPQENLGHLADITQEPVKE